MSEEKPKNQWKEIEATWDGEAGYVARNKAGATVLMGKDRQGNPGIGPMEMLLAGLAGCTMMDIVEIMRKKRQLPVDFKVIVRGNQRLTEYPYHYTEFEVEYLLWGENLQEKDVAQAVQLSEEKYCSVGGTLAKAGPIRSTFRILKPGESA
ncbi:MAG: osmotically inducible protein OsmC [Anaerolineae bacterium]|nr:MAG: osmotically inducible protein OsmC [Anaerolineae bacterium]